MLGEEQKILIEFKNLYDNFELWEIEDELASKYHEINSKIEAEQVDKELFDLLRASSREIVKKRKMHYNDERILLQAAVIVLGLMKDKESTEAIIKVNDLAYDIPMEQIDHYFENWHFDEYSSLRSACIHALSLIDDPKGYNPIYLATQEWNLDVAGDASKELTFDRFKIAVKNYSIFELKRLKYPLHWSDEYQYKKYVDRVLAERGFGIQNQEHQLVEKVVFMGNTFQDYEVEADHAYDFSEELKILDITGFLEFLIQEYETYSEVETLNIRESSFVAFFFHLVGFGKVKDELEELLTKHNEKPTIRIIVDLLSLIDNPKTERAFHFMTKRLEFNEKERIKREKREAEFIN